MSEENVEIVRRTFEQLEKGGVEAALRFLASDVVLYPFPEWVEASEYRGHDGIRRVLAVWTENFDDFTMELQELRDTGDRVVALYEQSGRIKGSGVRVRQPVGGVFGDFRDERIGEASFFQTWDEALEAAGLSE
jgi:ketosteroid isomerase-like protein